MRADQAIEILRAAGEPSRLRILALLARGELAVMELSHILDQSQPRVSRHLKLLSEAGLVERFPDGAWVFYRLTGETGHKGAAQALLGMIDPNDPMLIRPTFSRPGPRTPRPISPATPPDGTRSVRSMWTRPRWRGRCCRPPDPAPSIE